MTTEAAFLALGFAAGTLFFALLRWNAALYMRGGAPVLAVAIQLVRLSALAGVLALVALHGALPLLLTAAGLLIARPIVFRVLAGGAA